MEFVRVRSNTGPEGTTMSEAIQNVQNGDIDGQAKLLWSSNKDLAAPPKRWEHNKRYEFSIYHCPKDDIIQVKVFLDGDNILDTGEVKDNDGLSLKGGRLGVYVDSQENVKWEHISYRY